MSCPALVKLLVSLGVILTLNAFRFPLVVGVAVGATILGLWAGHGITGLAGIFGENATDLKTLLLIVLILQVICLSNQMSEAGVMRELVRIVDASLSKRRAMALLPALIGLLPMPGGALFSAPMVADCDRENKLGGRLKVQINYWFRHVWEYWWPLYPGVLLAIILSGLKIQDFVLIEMPLTIFGFLGGMIFLLRKIPGAENGKSGAGKGAFRRFLLLVSPILIVPAIYGAVWFALPDLRSTGGVYFLPMSIGLLVSALYLQVLRPLDRSSWRSILLNKKTGMLCVLVFIIMWYGNVIRADLPGGGHTLVSDMADEMSAWGIPVLLVMMLLPFLAGITTGIAVGYVGASFPIVFALLPADTDLAVRFSCTLLAYGCGFIGMMLSPIHVCFMVTAEHFNQKLIFCYNRLLGASAVVLVGVLLLSWAWGWPGVQG